MIYLIVFLLSLLFAFVSEKVGAYAKGAYVTVYRKIFIFLSLLPPVWLAGMRDLNIGTDVRIYGIQVFQFVKRFEHFTMALFIQTESAIEWGYRLLNFLVSRFTDDVGWLLGTICLIIIVCVYLALDGYKKYCNPEISITFGMFVFYMLFYNETYNLLRQSLAVAIVVFATRFMWKRKWKQFVIAVLVATSFHITAVIGLVLYPLYVYIFVKGKRKVTNVLSMSAVGIFFVLPYIINWIIRLGILPVKFLRYIVSGGIEGISVNQLIIRIPFIIIAFILISSCKTDELKNRYAFFAALLVIDLFLAELRNTNATLYRLSLYFSWLKVFMYTELTSQINIKIKEKNINWSKIGIVGFLVSLWVYQVVIQGNGETYPYVFH